MSENASNASSAPAGGGGSTTNVVESGASVGVTAGSVSGSTVIVGQQPAAAVVVDLPSYHGDVKAMAAHTEFVNTVILPHYEGLIAAARRAGMGEELISALSQGQEAVEMARTSVVTARTAVVALNEAVARAHADARAAATKKTYYIAD